MDLHQNTPTPTKANISRTWWEASIVLYAAHTLGWGRGCPGPRAWCGAPGWRAWSRGRPSQTPSVGRAPGPERQCWSRLEYQPSSLSNPTLVAKKDVGDWTQAGGAHTEKGRGGIKTTGECGSPGRGESSTLMSLAWAAFTISPYPLGISLQPNRRVQEEVNVLRPRRVQWLRGKITSWCKGNSTITQCKTNVAFRSFPVWWWGRVCWVGWNRFVFSLYVICSNNCWQFDFSSPLFKPPP